MRLSAVVTRLLLGLLQYRLLYGTNGICRLRRLLGKSSREVLLLFHQCLLQSFVANLRFCCSLAVKALFGSQFNNLFGSEAGGVETIEGSGFG